MTFLLSTAVLTSQPQTVQLKAVTEEGHLLNHKTSVFFHSRIISDKHLKNSSSSFLYRDLLTVETFHLEHRQSQYRESHHAPVSTLDPFYNSAALLWGQTAQQSTVCFWVEDNMFQSCRKDMHSLVLLF